MQLMQNMPQNRSSNNTKITETGSDHDRKNLSFAIFVAVDIKEMIKQSIVVLLNSKML